MKNILNLGLTSDDDTSLKLEEHFRLQRKVQLPGGKKSVGDDLGDKPGRRPAKFFKQADDSRLSRRTMYAS